MASLEGRQEDILKKLAKLKIDIEDLRIILRQPSQVTAASITSGGTCPPCPEVRIPLFPYGIDYFCCIFSSLKMSNYLPFSNN